MKSKVTINKKEWVSTMDKFYWEIDEQLDWVYNSLRVLTDEQKRDLLKKAVDNSNWWLAYLLIKDDSWVALDAIREVAYYEICEDWEE